MTTIAFKTTDEQEAFIRQMAAARKSSVSEFIRSAIAAMEPKKQCRLGGRPGRALVHHPSPTARITADEVRAIEEEMY